MNVNIKLQIQVNQALNQTARLGRYDNDGICGFMVLWLCGFMKLFNQPITSQLITNQPITNFQLLHFR